MDRQISAGGSSSSSNSSSSTAGTIGCDAEAVGDSLLGLHDVKVAARDFSECSPSHAIYNLTLMDASKAHGHDRRRLSAQPCVGYRTLAFRGSIADVCLCDCSAWADGCLIASTTCIARFNYHHGDHEQQHDVDLERSAADTRHATMLAESCDGIRIIADYVASDCGADAFLERITLHIPWGVVDRALGTSYCQTLKHVQQKQQQQQRHRGAYRSWQ